METILIKVVLAILALVLILGAFLLLVYVGFRMGRHTIGQPLPPIIKTKQAAFIEEDPYNKIMTGEDQTVSTVEG